MYSLRWQIALDENLITALLAGLVSEAASQLVALHIFVRD